MSRLDDLQREVEGNELMHRMLDDVARDRRRTHFIPYDSPKFGRQQRAVCGELVLSARHANDPTCPDCRGRLAETDSPV